MCAIVGQVGAPGSIHADGVVRLRDVLRHRGPDDGGVYVSPDGRVGLGHRRLSILDLSAAGRQPMANPSATVWLVFNGEIYNFRALRAELERARHAFRSATDSEVIVHGYEEWGLDVVHRLRGMFAFAIWDVRRRRLVLARDRLGIKPLLYWHDGEALTFASELRGVLADARVPRTIDRTAVYDYFTYQYVPTPKTAYAAVRKLPAGHTAVLEDGRLTVAPWWDLALRSTPLEPAEALTRVRAALDEVVQSHLVADVPVGVLLSGGVDSSAVTALAARDGGRPVETFTIGFDVAAHSEAPYAARVASALHTAHHELTVTREMALDAVREIVDLYDEPYADGSAIPTLVVCRLARRHVTVALSGEGGDEVFGGYAWYRRWLELQGTAAFPSPVRRLLFGVPARLLPRGCPGKWRMGLHALGPLERYAALMGAFLRPQKARLLAPRFLAEFAGYDELWHYRQFWRDDLDPLLRLQYLDLKTYLPDDLLTKLDRASMRVGLEGRVPLLDHVLVELVLGLPPAVRNPGGQPKHLLREAVAPLLPPRVFDRPKRGFSVPWYAWLAAGDHGLLDEVHDGVLHPDLPRRAAAFDADARWRLVVANRWLQDHAA